MKKLYQILCLLLLAVLVNSCSKAYFEDEEHFTDVTFQVLGIDNISLDVQKEKQAVNTKQAFSKSSYTNNPNYERMEVGVKYRVYIYNGDNYEGPAIHILDAISGEKPATVKLESGKKYSYFAYSYNTNEIDEGSPYGDIISPTLETDLIVDKGTFVASDQDTKLINLLFSSLMTEVEFFLDLSELDAKVHTTTTGSIGIATQLSYYSVIQEMFSPRGVYDTGGSVEFSNLPRQTKVSLGKLFVIPGPEYYYVNVKFGVLSIIDQSNTIRSFTENVETNFGIDPMDVGLGESIHYTIKIKRDVDGTYQPQIYKKGVSSTIVEEIIL